MAGASASSISSAMSTAFSGISGQAVSAIATVAPYAVAIMGAFIVWKVGVKFFSQVSKQG